MTRHCAKDPSSLRSGDTQHDHEILADTMWTYCAMHLSTPGLHNSQDDHRKLSHPPYREFCNSWYEYRWWQMRRVWQHMYNFVPSYPLLPVFVAVINNVSPVPSFDFWPVMLGAKCLASPIEMSIDECNKAIDMVGTSLLDAVLDWGLRMSTLRDVPGWAVVNLLCLQVVSVCLSV